MTARPEGGDDRAGLSPTRNGNARDNAEPGPPPWNRTAGDSAGAATNGMEGREEGRITRPAIMGLRPTPFQDPTGNPAPSVRWFRVRSHSR